jgi:hypothetical protein
VTKLPTAKELLKDALFRLPSQQGTKSEIMAVVDQICWQAPVNAHFRKTIE